MGIVEQFNGFHNTTVSRKTLTLLLNKAKKEKQTQISSRIIKILDYHPEADSFDIELVNLVKPFSLNAPRHTGIAKEALTDCGRLKKGYKYKNGKVVKVPVKKTILPKTRKTLAKNVFKSPITPVIVDAKKTNIRKKVVENVNLKTNLNVFNIPISQISIDVNRFQNREKLNENVLKQIFDNYNLDKLDPVIIWKDVKAKKIFLLAGHHRLEATKRKGLKIIQAKYFKGTESEAIHYAKIESNSNRSLELPQERAKIYREKIKNHLSKKEVLDSAKKTEGKNANYIVNLAYLNPKGITIQALDQLSETPDKQNSTIIERIADWIGEARKNNETLLNHSENEMFYFLQDKEASKRIKTKSEFLQKIHAITSNIFDFDNTRPLNLKRFANKTSGESVYEIEFKELKGKIDFLNDARADLKDRISNPKNKQYINPKDKDYKSILNIFDKQLKKYEFDLKSYQKQQLSLMQKKGNYTNAGSNQVGLFKPKTNEILNVNSLAYRMQNKTKQVHEYYIIHDKEISEFIGKIEKKKKESVAITLAAPQGGMKTRHCFQLMNAFAKNYKVGHASIEEHPLSSLYEDKIDEYLDNESLKNISSPEIKNIDDVHKLVRENDVIFIDSFSKLQKMQSSIKLDEDFRKKYDGKLFIIIYQLTTDGKMRGGSESQFDGDCIGFIEKKPNYKDNYVWWDKNRYQKTNLEDLKFNIFSKKIIRQEKPKKVDFNFKIS